MTTKLLPTLGKCLWAIILAIPVAAAQQDAAQQDETPNTALSKTELPGESSLPGQVAASSQGPAVADLPDESRLPSAPHVDSPDLAEIDTDTHTIRELASESELPSTRPLSEKSLDNLLHHPEAGAGQEPLVLDQNHPWLRLNVGGPTAPLKALKFTRDSKSILAGGDDKALHIWSLTDDGSGKKVWTYGSPVLWQVQRGTRGAIRAIDTNAEEIAFAGVGASSSMGEVVLAGSGDHRFHGALFDQVNGPKNYISSLAIDGSGRVSLIDVEGRVVSWARDSQTGKWQSTTLRTADIEMFDEPVARALHKSRLSGSAIATSQGGDLVYQELATPYKIGDNYPTWNLVRRSLETNKKTTLLTPVTHSGTVTAIGISDDGNRIVSADQTKIGICFLWDLKRSQMSGKFEMDAPVRTISVSPSGRFLMIGTDKTETGEGGPAKVALWRWNESGTFDPFASWNTDNHVRACCISPDEKWVAWAVNNSVYVKPVEHLKDDAAVLEGKMQFPLEVQFPLGSNDDYRVLLSSKDSSGATRQVVFETGKPRLADLDAARADNWIASNPFPQRWQLSRVDDDFGNDKWFVSIDGARNGRIPLDIQLDGSITCESWISDPRDPNRPVAIIVGTSLRNHVYLFRIADTGDCSLIRQYRGHIAPVLSTSVSNDQRYLVSCSQDGTVCIWKIEEALSSLPDMESTNRWGGVFQVENDKLVVKTIIPDGPLYFRGIRAGDIIEKLALPSASGTGKTIEAPQEILDTLLTGDTRQMLGFHYSRRNELQPYFYLFPAWQPVASLVVADDREWAYWTPYGFYDASFNGHKIFGWQVNKGLDSPPEFFRASELKNELEKPQLMEKLLVAGNIEETFLSLNRQIPGNIQNRVAGENNLRPRVEIQSPVANSLIKNGEVRIEAIIELQSGIDLARPKAFANGVPATEIKLESSVDDGSKQRFVYSWKAMLPNEKNIRIQVLAATQYESADVAQVDVSRDQLDSTAIPKLFLIGAGINQYNDRQIPQLEFAVNNVTAIKDVIAGSDNRLYRTEATLLTDESVNRSLWSVASSNFLDRMKTEARPDDLLVVFLSGHGFRDEKSEQYFYLTSATRHTDLLGRRYADCISLEDFGKFSEIPCRKIVILDTCHSGAVQPLSQSNLKTVVRALENDLIFTLTASEGTEEAFESTDQQMSYFSAALLQALKGEADRKVHGGNENGSVDFREVVGYVKEIVPRQLNRIGHRQYPTAAPAELLGFATIPLTSADLSNE